MPGWLVSKQYIILRFNNTRFADFSERVLHSDGYLRVMNASASKYLFLCGCSILVIFFAGGCRTQQDEKQGEKVVMAKRDINQVKDAHTPELMAIPGVVGVYIGQIKDNQPCIGVMVVKKTPELLKKIPKDLDGYPVKIDETGEIKPMK